MSLTRDHQLITLFSVKRSNWWSRVKLKFYFIATQFWLDRKCTKIWVSCICYHMINLFWILFVLKFETSGKHWWFMTGQRRQKSMLIMVQISGPVTGPSQILDNLIYPPEYSFDMLCSGSNKTYFELKIMQSIIEILIEYCLAERHVTLANFQKNVWMCRLIFGDFRIFEPQQRKLESQ